jgi:hypothetical protein
MEIGHTNEIAEKLLPFQGRRVSLGLLYYMKVSHHACKLIEARRVLDIFIRWSTCSGGTLNPVKRDGLLSDFFGVACPCR